MINSKKQNDFKQVYKIHSTKKIDFIEYLERRIFVD